MKVEPLVCLTAPEGWGSVKVIIKTFWEWSPAEEMDGRRGDRDGDVSRPAGADVYDIARLPGDS